MAWRFGAGMQADAFNFAFLIPNLLRRLLAEGAVSVALVPVFGDIKQKGEKGGLAELYRRAFGGYALFLFMFLAIFFLVAPYVIPYFVYGFPREKQELTVRLVQIMLPFILFLSIASVSVALLHTLKLFTAPALSPILLNIVIIGGIVFIAPLFGVSIYGVAISVSVAGGLILALQIFRLALAGVAVVPKIQYDPRLVEMLKLMAPAVVGVMVYYLNVLFSKFLASFLVEGSITYIYYSDRLFEFPLGIIAVSVATVTLPELSQNTERGRLASFRETLSSSVRLTLFVCIPAAAGLFVLREPIIELLFRRGEFSVKDAETTALVFRNALPGLIFVSAIRVITQAFYSLKKPILSVYTAGVSFLVNAALSLMFIGPFGVAGLTLANSASALVNFALSLAILGRLLKRLGAPAYSEGEKRKLVSEIFLMFVSSAVMGAAIYFVFSFIRESDGQSSLGAAASVLLLSGVGAGIYFALSKMLGISEADKMAERLLRRAKRERRRS
ncbi:MAG: murein biosynthesis integral membrane protein MurJ [Myxococcota bacterium]